MPSTGLPSSSTRPSRPSSRRIRDRAAEASGIPLWALELFLIALFLYTFLVGLDLMGLAFKLFGKGFAEGLIARTSNPFVGLVIGLLATSLVQSSSTTTSITVGLVAGGALTVQGAIPIVMGANIGTSVTNTIVSLAHVTRREEFRRAFAGATLHDFFNWLTVIVLLPLEIAFAPLGRTAGVFESLLERTGGISLFNPVKAVVRPAADGLSRLLGSSGAVDLVVGVALLFLALRFLVDLLRTVFTSRTEQILHRTLFRSSVAAIAAGTAVTVMVQSSSVTTSAVVPLVGAGIVSLEQLFPFTVGANLGTTVTALMAALVTGSPAAVTVALCHLLFNVEGMLLIYLPPPVRRIPLAMARGLGEVASRNRTLAFTYILVAFFGLPLLMLLLTGNLGTG